MLFLQLFNGTPYKRRIGIVDIKQELIKSAITTTVMVMIFSQLIMYFEDSIDSLFDAVWLAFVTVTTVGYGDTSAATTGGKIVSMVYMGFAITSFANTYNLVQEAKTEKRRRKINGEYMWQDLGQDYIAIINSPMNHSRTYLDRIVSEIRNTPDLRSRDILIVCEHLNELPASLMDSGVVFYKGSPSDPNILKGLNIHRASNVLVLARGDDEVNDSITFDLVSRIDEFAPNAQIIAEVLNDCNRDRIIKAGAESVIRPMRSYPGSLVRVMSNPSNIDLFENIFSSNGDSTVQFSISYEGKWSDIAMELLKNNCGTPIGYIDTSNSNNWNPDFDETVSIRQICMLVKDSKHEHHINDVLLGIKNSQLNQAASSTPTGPVNNAVEDVTLV